MHRAGGLQLVPVPVWASLTAHAVASPWPRAAPVTPRVPHELRAQCRELGRCRLRCPDARGAAGLERGRATRRGPGVAWSGNRGQQSGDLPRAGKNGQRRRAAGTGRGWAPRSTVMPARHLPAKRRWQQQRELNGAVGKGCNVPGGRPGTGAPARHRHRHGWGGPCLPAGQLQPRCHLLGRSRE